MSKTSRNSLINKSFKFQRHTTIGYADAIEDGKFLRDAFIDNGEIEILFDTDDSRSLIVGRTGVGKTALIEKIINSPAKVINIQPESLSLAYLADNEVIKFFQGLGVNLDMFYKLLWKHVLTIEIIKERYVIQDQSSSKGFFDFINGILPSQRRKRQAIEYLREWGSSFWQETDYRIKEVTKKLEEDFKSGMGTDIKAKIYEAEASGKFSSERGKRLSTEEKAEIVARGQQVVNSIQISTLNNVFDLLAEDIINDPQKKYYITIDRLDENWVDDSIRYNLIQALLDTAREFNYKLENLKVICAIREDLIDRVFRLARRAGYQEEKFKALYLPVYWSPKDIEELLDARVEVMVRSQYTSQRVVLRDLLPDLINKEDAVQYLIDRTLMRPRDAISLFNECIKFSTGKSKMTKEMILQAEPTYSENRLNALADEWSVDYPNLIQLAHLIYEFPRSFKVYEVRDRIMDKVLKMLTSPRVGSCESISTLGGYVQSGEEDDLIDYLLDVLFKVGILGISRPSFQSIRWSFMDYKKSGNDIDDQTSYYVHKAFWKALSIK